LLRPSALEEEAEMTLKRADRKELNLAPRTPKGEALNTLILTLFRTRGRLSQVSDALSRDLGLSSARWQVLGAIASGPKSPAQIARNTELTRQGVLWVVQSMEKDELIELAHNPDHRRAKLVRATALGDKLYREMSRRQRGWVNELAGSFNKQELELATKVLQTLFEKLSPSRAET
jgi:DNA-binding MarR family transcriptional regulator